MAFSKTASFCLTAKYPANWNNKWQLLHFSGFLLTPSIQPSCKTYTWSLGLGRTGSLRHDAFLCCGKRVCCSRVNYMALILTHGCPYSTLITLKTHRLHQPLAVQSSVKECWEPVAGCINISSQREQFTVIACADLVTSKTHYTKQTSSNNKQCACLLPSKLVRLKLSFFFGK